MKPSICFVSLNLYHLLTKDGSSEGIGGPEVQTLFIANELVRRGYEVSAITRSFNNSVLKQQPSFSIVESHEDSIGQPFSMVVSGKALGAWNALRKTNADIYFVNNCSFVLAPVVFHAKLRKKSVIFCGSSNPDFDPHSIRQSARDKWLFYWGLKRCDEIFVQNEIQRSLLKTHFQRDGRILYIGLPKKNHAANSRRIILWVGGMREVKNPHLFVELAARFPNERFVMVGGVKPSGKAPMKGYYREILDRAEELQNLEMTGYIPFEDADKYFEDAKVLINTSEVEGFPNAFVQAWARGVPVISFVGIDNLLEKNGLGVVAKDLDDMTKKVEAILTAKLVFSPERIRKFFEDNCTIERTVDVLEGTFNSIMHV